MLENNLFLMDKKFSRRRFNTAAANYTNFDFDPVTQEIGQRLLERLQLMRLQPTLALDLGCGSGQIAAALLKHYRKATVIALDSAWAMLPMARQRGSWRRKIYSLCADAEHIPLASNSASLIVSNLVLHWCNDLNQILQECWRVLQPNGLLLFSTYGPDTLQELRQSWQVADPDTIHVHPFIDMHHIGDALLYFKYSDPVMDSEYLTVHYSHVRQLLEDLQQQGAVNAALTRRRGLMGRQQFAKMLASYEALRIDDKIPATYEIVYGHAWKPEQVSVQRQSDGVIRFPLDRLTRRA